MGLFFHDYNYFNDDGTPQFQIACFTNRPSCEQEKAEIERRFGKQVSHPLYKEGFSTIADGDSWKVVPIPREFYECSTADPNEVHITFEI